MSEKKQGKENAGALHAGHRRRLMERLKKGMVLEHEALEALLFYAIPRRNTNDIAHRLLAKFGTVEKVFAADIDDLQTVQGIGERSAEYIFLIGKAYEKYFTKAYEPYTGKGKPEEFFPYVCKFYEKETDEIIDVYFLKKDGRVFGRARLKNGGAGTVSIDPRAFKDVLREYEPAGIILVHNHPFGEALPSKSDIEMTKKCQLICSAYSIMLCDHVIYAPNGVYSFYCSKDLQPISEQFSLSVLAGEDTLYE